MSWNHSRAALGAVLPLTLLLSACGGGSNANYEGSILNGQVLMGPQFTGDTSGGPVAGATVCAYTFLSNGSPAYTINSGVTPYSYNITAAATCQTTGQNGSFSFNLLNGVYGPVLLQAYGGSYMFKGSTFTLNQLNSTTLNLAASAANAFIATNAALQAVANVGGGGTVTVNITPLSTFAVARSNPTSGFTLATYQSNVANVATQLGIPGNVAVTTALPGSGGAADAYGQAMLGVEQYFATMIPYGGNTDDRYGANLLNWTSLGSTNTTATVSADYTAAFDTINNSTAQFNFN